jgi:hypothetical protein
VLEDGEDRPAPSSRDGPADDVGVLDRVDHLTIGLVRKRMPRRATASRSGRVFPAGLTGHLRLAFNRLVRIGPRAKAFPAAD